MLFRASKDGDFGRSTVGSAQPANLPEQKKKAKAMSKIKIITDKNRPKGEVDGDQIHFTVNGEFGASRPTNRQKDAPEQFNNCPVADESFYLECHNLRKDYAFCAYPFYYGDELGGDNLIVHTKVFDEGASFELEPSEIQGYIRFLVETFGIEESLAGEIRAAHDKLAQKRMYDTLKEEEKKLIAATSSLFDELTKDGAHDWLMSVEYETDTPRGAFIYIYAESEPPPEVTNRFNYGEWEGFKVVINVISPQQPESEVEQAIATHEAIKAHYDLIDAASRSLHAELTKNGWPEWLVAVGAGDELYVYTKSKPPKKILDELKKGWHGCVVNVENTGTFKP